MIPFALVVIVFSAVNRDLVTLDLWPLPNEITVPVFTLVLAVFIYWVFVGRHCRLGVCRQCPSARHARNALWRADTGRARIALSLSNTLHDRERELRNVKDSIDRDDKRPHPRCRSIQRWLTPLPSASYAFIRRSQHGGRLLPYAALVDAIDAAFQGGLHRARARASQCPDVADGQGATVALDARMVGRRVSQA